MSISPVSFSSTSFQDRINMPQAYQRKEEPVAASGIAITKKPKKKSHKLLKLVVAAGAIAAGFLTILFLFLRVTIYLYH